MGPVRAGQMMNFPMGPGQSPPPRQSTQADASQMPGSDPHRAIGPHRVGNYGGGMGGGIPIGGGTPHPGGLLGGPIRVGRGGGMTADEAMSRWKPWGGMRYFNPSTFTNGAAGGAGQTGSVAGAFGNTPAPQPAPQFVNPLIANRYLG